MHLLTLCRYLKRQKLKIVVACLREHVKDSRSLRPDFEREGIRVINLQADSRYNSFFLGKVTRVLREERPDVLHTHLPRADFAGAFARISDSGLVWICSVHALYSQDWAGRWSLPFFNLLWRRADAMLCISHGVRDWLVGRGLPADKARVIHYGIEPEKFFEPRVNLRKQWGLNGHVVIGSLGRLEPRKGHDLLITAMSILAKRLPNARLLIAGHDPWGYGATLGGLIDRLGLGEKVRLVGFQSDVSSFFDALDVFAFASSSEGFGQVLVEAMAARKPVVASKISPLTEIVVDEETGLLVEDGTPTSYADHLFRLLSHPEEREHMGRLGQERVRKCFTADKMSQATLSLYEELLRRTSPVQSAPKFKWIGSSK
jgi:glycosyltransferase involved in cell wall biosynthesis